MTLQGPLPVDHPLRRLCGAVVHRSCFAIWEHRAAFASAFDEFAERRTAGDGWRDRMAGDGSVASVRHGPLDEAGFWIALEYLVTREMDRIDACRRAQMWCDGFVPDTFELDTQRRHVFGTVWIGFGGSTQEAWTFELCLPSETESRECIPWSDLLPTEAAGRWLHLDMERKHLRFFAPSGGAASPGTFG